jgi:hypothetical protein
MAKANSKAARKTPKHITMLIELYKRLLEGVGNLPADKMFESYTELGAALERLLEKHKVKPQAVGKGSWIFRTAEEHRVDRHDSIKRDVKNALMKLQDASDLAGQIFLGKVGKSGLTPEAYGGLIEAAIDKVGRDLEQMLPELGLKLAKDEATFLVE